MQISSVYSVYSFFVAKVQLVFSFFFASAHLFVFQVVVFFYKVTTCFTEFFYSSESQHVPTRLV